MLTTDVRVARGVNLFGRMYWLSGRLLYQIHDTRGFDLDRWQLCGGVYTSKETPTTLRDIVFVPWVLPIPVVSPEGATSLELVAQVGRQVEEIINKVASHFDNASYKGEIRYTLSTKRRVGYIRRNIHIGELYSTPIPREFVIRLHAMPLMLAEPDTLGHIHPVLVLTAQPPLSAIRFAKRKRGERLAEDQEIIRGTL